MHENKVTYILRNYFPAEETEANSGISYNATTRKFYCHSKTKDPPVIAVAPCNSPIECELVDKCFTWTAPYTVRSEVL